MGERGLKHTRDPDGLDLLDHRPPVAAGRVWAARVPEVLLNGELAQAEIAADRNMVKLELGSRRETDCP
jgi:hypothetical protein